MIHSEIKIESPDKLMSFLAKRLHISKLGMTYFSREEKVFSPSKAKILVIKRGKVSRVKVKALELSCQKLYIVSVENPDEVSGLSSIKEFGYKMQYKLMSYDKKTGKLVTSYQDVKDKSVKAQQSLGLDVSSKSYEIMEP